MPERIFPIMFNAYHTEEHCGCVISLRKTGECLMVVGLPWDLIAPYDLQALKNHSQTLEQLAARGGMSACEACAVMENRNHRIMDEMEAQKYLRDRIHYYYETKVR